MNDQPTTIPSIIVISTENDYSRSTRVAILLILIQIETTDLQISRIIEFSERCKIFLWIASFVIKVPLILVHVWLPKSPVEAPMIGCHLG